MEKPESLEEFYQRKLIVLPENLRKDIGHFNIFRLTPPEPGKPIQIPYRRRDFYKVVLVVGQSRVHFADQVVEIRKQALTFSTP
jgi:AraC family transcriptional regulator, transcriptional activator of pobA